MNNGALRFARYAFPPNDLGYCGPDDAGTLLEYVDAGTVDGGLRQLSEGFVGAWPYLQLIAAANNRKDPLDRDVVAAYWVGNELLRSVSVAEMGNMIETRFKERVGFDWQRLAEPIQDGPVPHHSFHVFGVYPWVGLLRSGINDEPLRILDRCRISTGVVESVDGDVAMVRRRPLVWDGRALAEAAAIREPMRLSQQDRSLAGVVATGSIVTMHWDWVCETVSPGQARALESWTSSQLALINGVPHPGPARVLG